MAGLQRFHRIVTRAGLASRRKRDVAAAAASPHRATGQNAAPVVPAGTGGDLRLVEPSLAALTVGLLPLAFASAVILIASFCFRCCRH
jgi:hypothetical protein